MGAFRAQRPKVPSGNSVWQVGSWVSFLGVDEIRELNWVSDEENWCVISNHIPITFFSVELDCKASWISGSISWTLFASDSWESEENWCGFSNLSEQLGLGVSADIMSSFKVAMSTSALCMDNSFWNSLSVEMSEFVNQVNVVEGHWAVLSSCNWVLIIINDSSAWSGKWSWHFFLIRYYYIN